MVDYLIIQDDELIDSGESKLRFERAWVRCNGETRRITEYVPTTGVITVGRTFTSDPDGHEYEIHALLSPDEIDQVINEALVSLYYVKESVISVVADQTEYSLDAYAWLWDSAQIVDVQLRVGDTTNEYRYTPLTWWRFQRKTATEGTPTSMPYTGNYLQVKPLTDTTDLAIILRTLCPYQVLADDTEATGCPYDWLLSAAEWRIYDLLARDAPAADRVQMEQRRERAGVRLAMLNRKYMPRPKMIVQLADTAYGWSPLQLQDES